MGLHRCPDCDNTWHCKSEDCDYDGVPYTCPICSGRKFDCNPDTRMQYLGAFKDWEKSVV